MRDALVHRAGELAALARVGPVVRLVGRRRYRLDVDAHAVHVLQAQLDAGELRAALLHLLRVGLARQRIGELDCRVVLAGIALGHLRRHVRIEIVAVHVDAKALAFLFRFYDGRAFPAGRRAAVKHFSISPDIWT